MLKNKNNSLFNLWLSAISIILVLGWLFLGQLLIELVASPGNTEDLYLFFSGMIMALGIIGIYAFIKTVLCIAEIIVEKENLPLLMYRSVLEDDSEGIFFKNKYGRYKIINSIAQQVLGLNEKQVIGFRDAELHHSILAHRIEQEDKRVLENGETVVWETERKTDQGRDAFVCKKIPCRDKKGRIIGITGLCKNITVLKTFQTLNVELEERYRSLFNRLPYPVLVLDAITLLPFTFNDAMNDLLGYSKREFENMRFSMHAAEGQAEVFRVLMTDLVKQGGGEFDIKLKTKDKDLVDVSGYAQEVLIEDKKYLHVLLHDITEMKKSNNNLISSELKYRSLFEHANDAILIVDINTLHLVDANEIALSFFDYTRDDLNSLTLFDLDSSSNHQLTQSMLNDLEIYNHVLFEHEMCDRKNQCFNVEINAHKVNYGNNEVYQFVIRNISERKQTEDKLVASEQRYRQMFESNQAVKLVINPETHVIEDTNQAAAEFYGYSQQQMRGMPLETINVLSNEKLDSLIIMSMEQNLGYYTCAHKLANGDVRFVEVRDGPMDIDGQVLLYSIVHDVTASKEAEDQLVLASKMFDCSTDAVMITNDKNHVISVNQAFTYVTGYMQSEIIGHAPGRIFAGREQQLLSHEMLDQLVDEGTWQGEIWLRLKNGESKPLKSTINLVKDVDGKVRNHVIVMSSNLESVSEDGSGNVHYTSLTNLPNESLFKDRLKNAIDRAQRNEAQLAVLLVDFRDFSMINDQYGYDVGDSVLQAIAKRLKYNVRESDTVGHCSGDNFAVLLEDLTEVQQAGIVAQKIITTLAEDYVVERQGMHLEASIGISISPTDGVTVDELMTKANNALKQAEQTSGSTFKLQSNELDADAHIWLQTEQKLHKALRNDEFFVQYLPQITLTDEPVCDSLEALVRWRHDGQNISLPSKFLLNAEQSGFIDAIGYRVIDIAFKQFSQWINNDQPINRIFINICQTQIDEDLYDFLIDKSEKYKIAYSNIALDFSERAFVNATNEQKNILKQLQAKGFYICVDDFGSGAASLSCLMNCPVDAIKVDQSLIIRSQSNNDALSLLKGLLALAEKLEIDIIAEGIETAEQFEQLKNIGCQFMQGYYFSRPLTSTDVPDYIKHNIG